MRSRLNARYTCWMDMYAASNRAWLEREARAGERAGACAVVQTRPATSSSACNLTRVLVRGIDASHIMTENIITRCHAQAAPRGSRVRKPSTHARQ